MAMIAKELVRHEKVLEFTSIYEAYLRQNTDRKVWLVNTNKVVYE
jgi:D-alanyl-D-alanine carboxypeptidase (penicillin-binding protein 5/6)